MDITGVGNTAQQEDGEKQTQYLITGANGFLGREIAAQLREQGDPVRGLVRRKVTEFPMPEGMEFVLGDVLEPDTLDSLFAGIEPGTAVVIHAAGLISVRKRDPQCERVNLTGTENVLAACKKHGARHLVCISSVDALPLSMDGVPIADPVNFSPDKLETAYGRSKAAAAQRVLDAAAEGLNCTLLLPSAVVGPGDYKCGFITQMLSIYLSGIPRLSVKGGYEFVDVRDVAAAAIAASERSGQGKCYILSNRYADITYVFDTLAEYTGRKPTLFTLPLWVLYPLTPPVCAVCRITGRELPLTTQAVRHIRAHPVYCHDKAAAELGFSPRPLEQTLRDTAAFILRQREHS